MTAAPESDDAESNPSPHGRLAEPAIGAKTDPARNLLRLRFAGRVSGTEMHAALAQVEALLSELTLGFAALSDWSRLESMGPECVPHLTAIMDLCSARGVGLIVRVLPDPARDLGINILSLLHHRGKVQILTCDTLDEAERALP